MSAVRTKLNSYLALEFGMDFEDGEPCATESWPFELEHLGEFTAGGKHVTVFAFREGDEEFFAVADSSLNFFPRAGMTLEDLRVEYEGRQWLSCRDPVDQSMSRIGDPLVPSGLRRRAACLALAQAELGSNAVVSTSIFLKREQKYVVVASAGADEQRFILSEITARLALPVVETSEWRLLALGIGRAIEAGVLSRSVDG